MSHLLFALILLRANAAPTVAGYFDSYSQCQQQAAVFQDTVSPFGQGVCLAVNYPVGMVTK